MVGVLTTRPEALRAARPMVEWWKSLTWETFLVRIENNTVTLGRSILPGAS